MYASHIRPGNETLLAIWLVELVGPSQYNNLHHPEYRVEEERTPGIRFTALRTIR
jgi:hypothetical protein